MKLFNSQRSQLSIEQIGKQLAPPPEMIELDEQDLANVEGASDGRGRDHRDYYDYYYDSRTRRRIRRHWYWHNGRWYYNYA